VIPALLLLAAAPEPKLDCADPQDQSSMNLCAQQDYERADTEMNAQYHLAIATMRAADKQVDRSYDQQPTYYDTLVAAQHAWLTFRDQTCLLESFEARGGSMQPMLDSGCRARVTRERTKQLKSMVEAGN
jgi:uncharacterized protein YecT (DUF1311 family)